MIELLIVLAITTVLIAILLPSLSRAREQARRTVCLANLKHIGVGLMNYANNNRDLGPQVAPPLVYFSPRSLLAKPDGWVNLGLMLGQEVADAKLFRCPSQREFSYEPNVAHFGETLLSGSYAYAVHVPDGESPHLPRFRHLALVSDDFVRIEGTDYGAGRSSHQNVYNVLYVDGSAVRYQDADESIWRSGVQWDDESDPYTYTDYYETGRMPPVPAGFQPSDIFRVWRAFCYARPDTLSGSAGSGNPHWP